jgi:hypothetical protein
MGGGAGEGSNLAMGTEGKRHWAAMRIGGGRRLDFSGLAFVVCRFDWNFPEKPGGMKALC